MITNHTSHNSLFGNRILKWFGILFTLLIVTAAIAPDVLGIPLGLRPWALIACIVWLVTFSSGLSNQ